ncbi:MAG: PQQ-dependent sugar dehydrogenase [Hyphomonadaceae bacterium]
MHRLVLFAFLAAAACNAPNETRAQSEGAPVAAGAANTDYTPAFDGQTRAPEQRSGVTLAVEEIAAGLDEPWSIAFLPDGRALVTEREGRLRVVSRNGAVSEPVAGTPRVDARNQGGLLDVVLSPNFVQDRTLFLTFAEPRGGGANSTSVARGVLNADATSLDNVRVIFQQNPAWQSTGHYGSRIVFDREGLMFVTFGDRQGDDSRESAQDLGTHIGKVVRINTDGSAADGNPFAGRAGALPEIWSYGHRNVQGAALHPETGDLWTVEHGPRGGDEINITRAGLNYGWPVISYGIEYRGAPVLGGISAQEGMEQPLYYWDPVIAPGDMDFYRGELFPWRGDLLVAGLRAPSIVRLEIEGERVVGEERLLTDQGRVRDIEEAADGALWVITDEDNGRVLRVTPAS